APVASADDADTDNTHVTSLVSRSGGAAGIRQHDGNRLEHDLQVEPQRPGANVDQVQLAHLPVGEPVPTGDLPEAGDAGAHLQPVKLPVRSEERRVCKVGDGGEES